MWICQKCNAQNTANFCMNCGASVNEQTADDLPPTVVGFQPPIVPNQFQVQNQPNHFQPPNQPNQFPPNQSNQFQPQNQPNFAPHQPQQNQPNFPPANAPAKSGNNLVIGGIIGLLVVVVVGVGLWFGVLSPYFKEQARLKKEYENGLLAKMTQAKDLLPEEFTNSVQMTFRKGKMVDKMQLLQASQNLPPELKSELTNINDAAGAEYISTTDSNKKIFLQIFKYNTPAQSVAACDKVGLEIEKNKSSLQEVEYYRVNEKLPDNCHASAANKNGVYTGVSTLYGFLMIASGHIDSRPGAATRAVFNKLER